VASHPVSRLVYSRNLSVVGIFENILGFNPELSTTPAFKSNLMPWLLNRAETKVHDENRSYAAELLSILLQNDTENRLEFGQNDGVETILKTLSVGQKDKRLKSNIHL
jgi:beta-catenin-like protein 1